MSAASDVPRAATVYLHNVDGWVEIGRADVPALHYERGPFPMSDATPTPAGMRLPDYMVPSRDELLYAKQAARNAMREVHEAHPELYKLYMNDMLYHMQLDVMCETLGFVSQHLTYAVVRGTILHFASYWEENAQARAIDQRAAYERIAEQRATGEVISERPKFTHSWTFDDPCNPNACCEAGYACTWHAHLHGPKR